MRFIHICALAMLVMMEDLVLYMALGHVGLDIIGVLMFAIITSTVCHRKISRLQDIVIERQRNLRVTILIRRDEGEQIDQYQQLDTAYTKIVRNLVAFQVGLLFLFAFEISCRVASMVAQESEIILGRLILDVAHLIFFLCILVILSFPLNLYWPSDFTNLESFELSIVQDIQARGFTEVYIPPPIL